ncbi:MAG: molybdate ABC transporter substrate-binding protein [Pseudomonadota bacterium]
MPVAQQLEEVFEARSDHDVTLISGSTGKFFAQIKNGAPFDVFLAADQERPALLEEEGAAVPGSRITYAVGTLVLWSAAGDNVSASTLKTGGYARLALAQPRLAPYGAAGADVLAELGLDCVIVRCVFGENVAQAFAFVKIGAAPAGFVSLSQVLALPEDARGAWWTPSPTDYAPIRQDGVLLARAAGNDAAKAFLAFLHSDEAMGILTDYGYALP